MQFRTQIPIRPEDPKINYVSEILLLGSCFVEHMGRNLNYFKFRNLLNPFGILFHPAAIHTFLKKVKNLELYAESDLFYHNETWHCFQAHSIHNHPEKDQVLLKLNAAVEESHQFIKNATHVIITPGTAWGYRYKETGEIVANCHKVPQQNFTKELLRVENDLAACAGIIKEMNPSASVIFTISPVRHLRDGFIENQRSKARLVEAIHEIVSRNSSVFYFPSYEIMMDDLRDYRFYAEDMVHPNEMAVKYIWERFREAWISDKVVAIMEQVDRIQKGLAHKPFDEASQAHKTFKKNLRQKIEKLESRHPKIRF